MEPIQEFRKLQERLVESEMRILLIIYYKKKLKLQEDKNKCECKNVYPDN